MLPSRRPSRARRRDGSSGDGRRRRIPWLLLLNLREIKGAPLPVAATYDGDAPLTEEQNAALDEDSDEDEEENLTFA